MAETGTNGSDLESQVRALSDRLAILEAERDIVDTLSRYGHAIDYGDEAAWVDCFTADGAYDLQFLNGGGDAYAGLLGFGQQRAKGVRIEGQEDLARFISQHTRIPYVYHKHYMMEPRVTADVQAGTASVHSYFARVDLVEGAQLITAFGRYIDQLVRETDGRWRFTERLAEIEAN